MAIDWYTDGSATMFQGDTGYVTITGINTDYDWTVYFAIHDKNRNQVGEEQYIQSDNLDRVRIFIPKELSDLMTVPKNQKKEIYTYGIKACREENGKVIEDTYHIGTVDYEKQNTITVYPRKAQGTV